MCEKTYSLLDYPNTDDASTPTIGTTVTDTHTHIYTLPRQRIHVSEYGILTFFWNVPSVEVAVGYGMKILLVLFPFAFG